MVSTGDKAFELQRRISAFIDRGWQVKVEDSYVIWHDPNSMAFIRVSINECPLCFIMKYNIKTDTVKH